MEQLAGPLQEVFGDLKRKWQEFQEEEPFLHVLQGFVHAIDWTVRLPVLARAVIITCLACRVLQPSWAPYGVHSFCPRWVALDCYPLGHVVGRRRRSHGSLARSRSTRACWSRHCSRART